jgi:hypothetical protein
MTTDIISSDEFRNRFSSLKEEHFKEIKDLQYRIDLS